MSAGSAVQPHHHDRRVGRGVAVTLLALLALVLAACSGDGAKADGSAASTSAAAKVSAAVPAVVGGVAVHRADVRADLAAEAVAAKAGRSAASKSALAHPVGADGKPTAAAKAAALTNRILDQIYAQTMRKEGVTVTAADRATARESLCADSSTGQAPAGTACPPLAGYPAAYRAFTTRLLQRQVAFGRHIYAQTYADVKRTHPSILREVCVDLVQTADAATADQIKLSVAKGTDVGKAIAAPVKAGKASEAREGCLFLDDAPAALQKAHDGDVVTVSEGTTHYVAQVLQHKLATQAEFITQPPSSATVRRLVDRRVARAAAQLGVSVEPSWGKWTSSTFAVSPPGGSSGTSSTTAPTAVPLGTTTTAPD